MSYQSSLPPNNGAGQELRFEQVRKDTMRQTIATGVLDELEYGLLKGSSKSNAARSSSDKALGWGVEEKGLLLNMEVEILKAWQGGAEMEVRVRNLCYSRGVTADYLKSQERFNMKQCVFVLGDVGRGSAPWADLVQTAVYLHRHEFNIIWVEVPSWKSDPQLWLKYGSELIRGLFKFLCIKKVSCVSCGIGGAVFLQVLSKAPQLFARTHFIYNMDQPKGKAVQLPIFELEQALRKQELQIWFAYKDDDVYDRFADGTPQKAYDAVQKLQARLLGEKQRKKTVKAYDEVIITENLNMDPVQPRSKSIKISIYPILKFTKDLLDSISFFLESAPGTHQETMVKGLVADMRSEATAKLLEGVENDTYDNEPVALRRARIGHEYGLDNGHARHNRSRANRKRLEILDRAAKELNALPDIPGLDFHSHMDLMRKLGDRSSRSSSQASSRSASQSGSKPSRSGTRSGTGSRLASHSRAGSKEEMTNVALPALLQSSSSAPNLQALANEPAYSEEDEKDETFFPDDGEYVFKTQQGQEAWQEYRSRPKDEKDETFFADDGEYVFKTKKGQEAWQEYRSQWQSIHRKTPGYTIPMEKV